MATDQSHVYTFGTAHFYGDPRYAASQQAAHRRRVARRPAPATGCSASTAASSRSGRRKFYGSTGGLHLNQPINGMERTADNGGYWLVAVRRRDLHVRRREVLRLDGRMHLNQPVLGMERTRVGQRLLAVRPRRRHLQLRRREVLRLGSAARTSRRRSSSMQRTPDGHGYWMLDARTARCSRSATRTTYGDISGCTNYGGATRLLVSPTRQGLLDRDRRRQRDRLRRRQAPRLPGRDRRPARSP